MPKPSGTVYLCANAIIDNSYTNTIDFKNPSEQQSYWGSLIKFSISDFMYIRRTQGYIKVNKNLTELEDVNYLFFRAEENAKLYYCFVTTKEYISDNASYIYFETDVLQTYMFDYEVKESYVLQEHVDRWTAKHEPVYSRTDEGLDYGSEYTVESGYRIAMTDNASYDWYLVVMKSGYDVVEGKASEPTNVQGVVNPYTYLLLPAIDHKNEDYSDSGASCKLFNPIGDGTSVVKVIASVNEFQKFIAKSEVSSFVVQILRLPYLPFNFKYADVSEGDEEPEYFFDLTTDSKAYVTWQSIGEGARTIEVPIITKLNYGKAGYTLLAELGLYEGIEGALPTQEQWQEVKANPYKVPRDKRFESKLLTHPYRYNLLTDWKNQPAIIKNEYIGADKIKVDFTQGICFNAPARYWVEGYKKDPEGRNTHVLQTLQEDVAIINSEYYVYMLQNRNQLQAERNNALTSLAGGVISNTVQGAISGGAVGGAGGAIGGAVLGGVGTAFSGGINYQNLIRGQNAKVKDLKNLPDQVVSANDISFNIHDDNKYLCFYRIKVCCEFEQLLADTFATSGYTVKRVKLPNLKTRLRYNYVKTVGANIVGSFNQDDLARIKAIFDNGITFWHYNTVNFKPYDYSFENIETILL